MKTIYEFYYIVGQRDFINTYILKADKETQRMIYGTAYTLTDEDCGRFQLNKSKVGTLSMCVNERHGSFCKIWIEEQENIDPKEEAYRLIYHYLMSIANQFKGDE